MKVSFFHDVKMIEYNDDMIYSVDFGYEVWERYLSVFEEITVCTRVDDNDKVDISKYKLSSGKNVKFKLNREYKSPIQFFTQRKKIKKTIDNVVKESDVCIIRLPSIIGILAAKACIEQNKPWAVEVVACCWDSLWNYGNIKGKLLAPIMYLLNKKYIRKSSHTIYVSERFLQQRYPCKGVVASASDVNIINHEFNVIEKRLNKVKSINKNQPIILGLVGSLDVEFKGHRTAIEAISKLCKEGYNVKLQCLGGGNKEKWEKLCKKLEVEDKVEFLGTLPSGQPVLEWMDKIDVFVMPSLQEGLPRSMVEAMSRGCNIIGAKTGGIPELIDDEFIFKKKDYKEMSNLIIKLIENDTLRENQSKRNFDKSKRYSKNKIDKSRHDFWKIFRHYVEGIE